MSSERQRAPRTGVVLMAYGSPRGPSEVEAYYTDIRRGSPPSAEQLAELTRRYEAIGGWSPLRERSEAQRRALAEALHARGAAIPVHLGYLHAEPRIEHAVAAACAQGAEQLVGIVLAPHDSAGSVGRYAARLADASPIAQVCLRSWATAPAFVEATAAEVVAARRTLPAGSQVVFTAHSLPSRMIAGGDQYPDEVGATAAAVVARAGVREGGWEVAWQSAGRTAEPWLGPSLLDVIGRLAAERSPGLLVSAVGFVSDHLEVLYDLDIEAAERAAGLGLAFARTACVNAHPAVFDHLAGEVIRLAGELAEAA